MKKILYLFLTVSLIFSACNKEDEVVAVDIRTQMVGNYTGVIVLTTTDLSTGSTTTDSDAGIPVVCVMSGETNVHITIGDDPISDANITLNCNVITEVAGGLTFQIIETDGVTFFDCDGLFSDYFIVNGEDDPQTYTTASNTLDFSFAMENGSCMYEVSMIATK